MLKYVDAKIVFAEVPNEITLAISISGCPCHCKGCHSAYLAGDIGILLDEQSLELLIKGNKGITCVAFMGGDSKPELVNNLAAYIKKYHNNLKVAWYSGRQKLSDEINLWNFDYIKLGPYKEECGPLNKGTTNQRFYEVVTVPPEETETNLEERWLCDITDKFWKHDKAEN